jgi:predicted ATP-grasp superfamily ATP-dependent carboligase
MKLANNNELELEKAKCTNDVLILNIKIDDLTETVSMYESSLNEKREEVTRLNQQVT